MSQNDEQDKSSDQEPEQAANTDAETGINDDEAVDIDQLTAENAELKDKLLRALADVENLRQRSARELEDGRRYAITSFARDLLDVADNLRRALDSAPDDDNASDKLKTFVSGIEITERSLLAAFDKTKISKVAPARGDRFDHKIHQAMFEVPTDELEPGHVAEVMQPGYVIADRLLRPALVGVSKKLPPVSQPEPDGNNERGQTVDTEA